MKMNLILRAGMLVLTAASSALACGGSSAYAPSGQYTAIRHTAPHQAPHCGFTGRHSFVPSVSPVSGLRTTNLRTAEATQSNVPPSAAPVSSAPAVTPNFEIETPPPAPVADANVTDNQQTTASESSTTNNRLETFFSGLSTEDLLKFSGLDELR